MEENGTGAENKKQDGTANEELEYIFKSGR